MRETDISEEHFTGLNRVISQKIEAHLTNVRNLKSINFGNIQYQGSFLIASLPLRSSDISLTYDASYVKSTIYLIHKYNVNCQRNLSEIRYERSLH